jgi:hypothetical protein
MTFGDFHFRAARLAVAAIAACNVACSGDGEPPAPVRDAVSFGEEFSGDYHIGPVDFAETEWTNSCSPYPERIQELSGPYLAGVDVSLNGDGSLCDACALVTTRLGQSIVVRIVTTGFSGSSGDMDLSPEAYDAIYELDPQGTGADPRPMTWQLAECPDNGNIHLQYQTGAHTDWTSFWVRNGRLPIESVEVRSSRHSSFFALRREADGTFNDDDGFGEGSFELRITGMGGETVSQSFSGFQPGAVVETSLQFD